MIALRVGERAAAVGGGGGGVRRQALDRTRALCVGALTVNSAGSGRAFTVRALGPNTVFGACSAQLIVAFQAGIALLAPLPALQHPRRFHFPGLRLKEGVTSTEPRNGFTHRGLPAAYLTIKLTGGPVDQLQPAQNLPNFACLVHRRALGFMLTV